MTDKPILSEKELKNISESLGIYDNADKLCDDIEALIRSHVVKALDGIELPKRLIPDHPFMDDNERYFKGAFNLALSEVKQAIEKKKGEYKCEK